MDDGPGWSSIIYGMNGLNIVIIWTNTYQCGSISHGKRPWETRSSSVGFSQCGELTL